MAPVCTGDFSTSGIELSRTIFFVSRSYAIFLHKRKMGTPDSPVLSSAAPAIEVVCFLINLDGSYLLLLHHYSFLIFNNIHSKFTFSYSDILFTHCFIKRIIALKNRHEKSVFFFQEQCVTNLYGIKRISDLCLLCSNLICCIQAWNPKKAYKAVQIE